ncbi:adenylate/guanylate cyclase domain-containing protein [Microvirga arabica]|uniref:adenylate/guanylate cyclase domain-containing protein n=1 Tax=Microvirga arabica TaxID=1128671 RepID=UPI0019396A2C|nr:adenylate/guanylate cyclase domain-containing protein [Microvirga arabica]MBM1169456.1 response regulator [Microvirga arabica]
MTDAGVRILVVDDNEDNRYTLTRRLQREGWMDLTTAENGREALDRIARERFDLVLLDIMMPEINGYEVLRHLKTDPSTRDIPVLMISALSEFESVVRCIELGAEDYLPKPFNPALLRARVGACLEKKRLHDQELSYLAEIDRQRRRAEALLHAILPSQAVDELEQFQTVTPRRHDDVVVFFADIVGFTAYCDLLAPEVIVANLHVYASTFEDIASQHGLEKIKTVGDGFLATAGLLLDNPDPVMASIACAMATIASARILPLPWDVRVGIHVGPVVAGVVGRQKFSFDIWGDTVNVAARLAGYGRQSGINLSAAAWERVRTRIDAAPLGPVPIKGKGDVEAYRVSPPD